MIRIIFIALLLFPLAALAGEPSLDLLTAKLETVQAKREKVRAEYRYGKLLMETSSLRAQILKVVEVDLKKQIAEANKIKIEGEQ